MSLLDVVGALLPAAAGIALSPFPIVGAILVVSGPRGRAAGPTFALGWLVGLTALTAVAIALGELVGGGEAATWVSWVRVLLGAALAGLGVKKFLARPRGDDDVPMPGWMAGLANATPGRAIGLGAGLAALNPKNVAFALASASVIGQLEQTSQAAVIEGLVFVGLASASVLAVVVLGQVGGVAGARVLAGLKETLLAHNDAIVAAVLLLIGVSVLGTGLGGLG
jgi:hypothetical protein